jgi:hypothetical protein
MFSKSQKVGKENMPIQKDKVLFNLPITKQWLEQYILVHNQSGSIFRDMRYSLTTLFDVSRSMGWVHNVLKDASNTASKINNLEDLSNIKVSANDEMFDHQKPILTSVCTNSLYCPLLQKEGNRKAVTWELRLLELLDKGYHPKSIILDGLNSLHAGHKLALYDVNIIYDTFHITQDLVNLRRYANNKLKSSSTNLYSIMEKLERAKDKAKIKSLKAQLLVAQKNYDDALSLYQSIATLCSWMQHDILVVAGYEYAERLELLGFIADEFEKLEDSALSHRIQPVRKTLQKNAEKLLGFLKDLENELADYADELNCDIYWLWQLCYAQRYSKDHNKYYQFISKIRSRFKHDFHNIEQTVIAIMGEIEKASSVVENLNGRIRKFLINHIHVSQESLNLLRFILNHREFERSRCDHREGKSPAEVLHGKGHDHWLEQLGYKLFKQAA